VRGVTGAAGELRVLGNGRVHDLMAAPAPPAFQRMPHRRSAWFTAGMSLTVSVYVRDGSGKSIKDEALGGSLAAGFENWRTQVWGSPEACALGAEYFPRLAGADLCVGAGEMTAFLRECALLREHLDVIAAGADLTGQRGVAVNTATGRVTAVGASLEIFREQISLRLANIEAAARRALEVGGEVVIW
jgi:hypothetical protein